MLNVNLMHLSGPFWAIQIDPLKVWCPKRQKRPPKLVFEPPKFVVVFPRLFTPKGREILGGLEVVERRHFSEVGFKFGKRKNRMEIEFGCDRDFRARMLLPFWPGFELRRWPNLRIDSNKPRNAICINSCCKDLSPVKFLVSPVGRTSSLHILLGRPMIDARNLDILFWARFVSRHLSTHLVDGECKICHFFETFSASNVWLLRSSC